MSSKVYAEDKLNLDIIWICLDYMNCSDSVFVQGHFYI